MTPRERFEALYAEQFHRILGYALRRTDLETAQDVVAETFLTAWRRLDDVPSGREARLWLYGVARRVLANARRGALRRDRLRVALQLDAMRPHVDSDVADGSEQTPDLAGVFGRLPPADQDLLGLVAWESLDYRQLGLVLGCSANAVKIRVHRARRRLAALLDEEGTVAKRPESSGHASGTWDTPTLEETK